MKSIISIININNTNYVDYLNEIIQRQNSIIIEYYRSFLPMSTMSLLAATLVILLLLANPMARCWMTCLLESSLTSGPLSCRLKGLQSRRSDGLQRTGHALFQQGDPLP